MSLLGNAPEIAQIDNANTAMRYSLSRKVLTEHVECFRY